VSGDEANSSVIPIRSRPVIAANCIGKALDQGVQEKALRLLAVPKKVLPTVHNQTTRCPSLLIPPAASRRRSCSSALIFRQLPDAGTIMFSASF
jgi:hypothetical protein